MGVLGQCLSAERAVLHRSAGVFAAAGAELNDAVGFGFGKRGQRGIDGVGARHIDAGKGIISLLRGIQHAGEGGRIRNGHG